MALIFDFVNGFHDAANSIATLVSTRVLKPSLAVVWAAFFNFVAFLFFGLHVANTIGQGFVEPLVIGKSVVGAALLGAITWDLLTWYFGIPSSSSHALIGGLGGAAVAKSGWSALNTSGFIKISCSVLLSPLLGFVFSYIMAMTLAIFLFRTQTKRVDSLMRRLQIVSASLYSLGHGANDAQKTMGIIAVLLFSEGLLGSHFYVPFWVVLACHGAMAMGTLFGGWRIVKTMGMKITKLQPIGGFCAETGGAATLFLATAFGIPVSTTHTITGAIMGVGTVNKFSAVRWGLAHRIMWAWILTIPVSGLLSAFIYYNLKILR